MKYFIAFTCSALLFSACQKNAEEPEYRITLEQLVDSIEGSYLTTAYCVSGSGISGYNYDTAYNVPLIVGSFHDTVLVINNYFLEFHGNLENKNYYFYQPASGGGHHAIMDSFLQVFTFSYWDGGLGGGSGCTHMGEKEP